MLCFQIFNVPHIMSTVHSLVISISPTQLAKLQLRVLVLIPTISLHGTLQFPHSPHSVHTPEQI